MSPYDHLGEAATSALVKASEEWPHHREIQSLLADAVREYQIRKSAHTNWNLDDKD